MKSKKEESYCCEDVTSRCRDGMKDPYLPLVWRFVGNMTDREAMEKRLSVSGLVKGTNLYHAYKMELIDEVRKRE